MICVRSTVQRAAAADRPESAICAQRTAMPPCGLSPFVTAATRLGGGQRADPVAGAADGQVARERAWGRQRAVGQSGLDRLADLCPVLLTGRRPGKSGQPSGRMGTV
jgi:hypothetical protein